MPKEGAGLNYDYKYLTFSMNAMRSRSTEWGIKTKNQIGEVTRSSLDSSMTLLRREDALAVSSFSRSFQ